MNTEAAWCNESAEEKGTAGDKLEEHKDQANHRLGKIFTSSNSDKGTPFRIRAHPPQLRDENITSPIKGTNPKRTDTS